jgi:VanZ family protein
VTATQTAAPVSKRPLFGLAAVFMAFAAYGSFVPFDLKRVPLDEAIGRFAATPFVPLGQASRSDLVTNVLLFVPIGFFLLGTLAGNSRRLGLLAWPLVILTGFVFATGVEFGQIFVSGRTPSWNDVMAETTGAAAGGAVWLVAGPYAAAWFREAAAAATPADRFYRILTVYTALWLVLGLLPFDYTVRPQELAEKFRAGRIVLQPFAGGTSVADVINTFVMAVPIGAFGYLGARTVGQPVLAGFGVVAAATGLTEFAQLLAVSRTASVTDALVNLIGGAVGVWLAARTNRAGTARRRRVRVWPIAALLGWSVLLAARHWSPFDFTVSRDFIGNRLDLMLRVPFHSYYWGMPLFAFAEASTKFLLGVPVGALLQQIYSPQSGRGRATQTALVLIAGTAIFGALEVGQLLLPSRIPDQTDIYIGVAGCAVGLLIGRALAD